MGSTLWFDPDLRVVVGPTQDFSSDQQRPRPAHTPARPYKRPRREKPCSGGDGNRRGPLDGFLQISSGPQCPPEGRPQSTRRVRTPVPHKRGIHYLGLPGHPRRFEHLSSSANGSLDRIPVQKARLALAYSRATLVKEILLFLRDFHA